MGSIQSTKSIEHKYYGFRVFQINKNGPLFNCNKIREGETFILPPDNIISKRINFKDYLKNNCNTEIELTVYSILTRAFSTIKMIPSNSWGNENDGYLGAKVYYENWSTAHKYLIKVIKVKKDSLAEKIHLEANNDFIIAFKPENTDIITLNQDDQDAIGFFCDKIKLYLNKNVEFYILNPTKGFRIEKALLMRNKTGEILGCDLGYGKAHEYPYVEEDPINESSEHDTYTNSGDNIDENDSGKEEKETSSNMTNNNNNNDNNLEEKLDNDGDDIIVESMHSN